MQNNDTLISYDMLVSQGDSNAGSQIESRAICRLEQWTQDGKLPPFTVHQVVIAFLCIQWLVCSLLCKSVSPSACFFDMASLALRSCCHRLQLWHTDCTQPDNAMLLHFLQLSCPLDQKRPQRHTSTRSASRNCSAGTGAIGALWSNVCVSFRQQPCFEASQTHQLRCCLADTAPTSKLI